MQLSIALLLFGGAYYVNDNKEINKNVINKPVIKDIQSNLNIYYLDVGQADSILIQNNNKNMLIDCGNNSDGVNIINYLHGLGVLKLDVLVGTHPHEDHIGGMDEIIDSFDIGDVYMPDVITTTKTFEDVMTSLEKKNMKITIPKIDSNFKLGDMNFNVLYSGSDSNNLNDDSIVLKLLFKNTSYLFMGDASTSIEYKLLNKDIRADVLKIGHHGSSYSTGNEFLDIVNPKYAIISVGKNNIYNHPANATIGKLNNSNVNIYRTDKDKTIKVISDGENIDIKKLDVVLDG